MNKQKYTAQELIKNPSFKRWVDGTSFGKEEATYWDHWIQKSERNRHLAIKAQKIRSGISFQFDFSPSNELANEWADLRKRLDVQDTSKRDLRKLHEKSLPARKKPVGNFIKVAAIIVVTFALSWYLATNSPFATSSPEVTIHTISTKAKEKKTISLSDGSKIILAAGSELSYAGDWLAKPTKRVRLKGEAYFSIVPLKVKDHPKFIVQTTDGTAAVWGTKFSVSTSAAGTQVVLAKGKVKLNIAGLPQGKGMTMVPGQLADFQKAHQHIAVRHVNPLVYTSWASNKLVFDNTPLSMLVERIKQMYGVQVNVNDQRLLKKKLSGSVHFKDLDSLIQAVSKVLKINISRKNNMVYIR